MTHSNIKLLDCTIRDGGYINDWSFPFSFAQDLACTLSDAKVDYIELGFLKKEPTSNLWTNVTQETISQLKPFLGKTKVSLLADYKSITLEDVPNQKDAHFQLLRIATHKKDYKQALNLALEIKQQKGIETTINFMGISSYSNEEILTLAKEIQDHKEDIKCFYLADSFGALLPEDTKLIFEAILSQGEVPLGFHPHNNLQLAFANTLEAIRAGACMIDASISGMGRGAGNLHLEIILAYLNKTRETQHTPLPVLRFIDIFMMPLKQKYNWGYSTSQLVSGLLSCHPNYPKHLLETKTYSIDAVYSMLSSIPEKEKSLFTKETLQDTQKKFLEECASRHKEIGLNLKSSFKNTDALILCSGPSIAKHKDRILKTIESGRFVSFSINRDTDLLETDYVFFGNNRRWIQYQNSLSNSSKTILGTRVIDTYPEERAHPVTYTTHSTLNYDLFDVGVPTNSALELAYFLIQQGAKNIYLAGLDGYTKNKDNFYYEENDHIEGAQELEKANNTIAQELSQISTLLKEKEVSLHSLTPSIFSDFFQSTFSSKNEDCRHYSSSL
tara:strand:+ start:58907 stop:60577 length:1671 start_codon:yes stop_codon:yes gene_type:complete